MRKFTKISMLLVFCLSAAVVLSQTFSTSNIAPEKTTKVIQYDPSIYPPSDLGGETIATAVPIPGLPYNDIGGTCGSIDDYDEVCPSASTSPDVVYSFFPTANISVDISLCNSSYDTKLFVYDFINYPLPGTVVGCDDDGCPGGTYRSIITDLQLLADTEYFIVVDGWNGDCGDYEIDVTEHEDCVLTPPGCGIPESEACGDDVNGGCNMATPTFEVVNPGDVVYGTFWADGSSRDTDWFELTLDFPADIALEADAQSEIIFGAIADASGNILNLDCGDVAEILPYALAGPCSPSVLNIFSLSPGTYWFFVASTSYDGFPCDQEYWIMFNFNCDGSIPAPWSEGFENCGLLPQCWTQEYVVGTTDWQYTYGVNGSHPSAPHGGDYNAYFNGSTGNSTKLVTPALDITTLANPTLSFWHTQQFWSPDQDELRVYYKTSAAGSWTLLAEYLGDIPDWTEETLTLPSPSNDYYISFESLDGYGYGIGLDDVSVYDGGEPPACPAPTNQTETNITPSAADLEWNYAIDSFFDIFVVPEFDPPPGPATIPTVSSVPGNSYTWTSGVPSTSYDWYVRADCGFTDPKVDYFWIAMETGSIGPDPLFPQLSGGTFDPLLGEDGEWYLYDEAPIGDWWNIWFYNDDFDDTRMKKIKMGFWIQSYNGFFPGNFFYVVNWSNDLYPNATGTFPTPLEENFIERSPINLAVVPPGTPQWIELTYIIEDYNPEWVSIDLWGDNIQILDVGGMEPPVTSMLYDYWVPGSPGGIIVHECLPKPLGNNSTWTGPSTFTTLAPPPANDLCPNAIPVICGSVTSGTTVDATIDAVPDCFMTPTSGGVWYSFVGTGAMVSADLCTTTIYDSRISVYDGTCGALTCVDGNDDYCALISRVDWFAANGTTYYILVHGYNTNTGAFDLTIDCTDPATATWIGGDASFGDPNPLEDWFGADNWFEGDVPGATTNVTLPPGLSDYPTIDRAAVCNSLVMESDASGTATILGNEFLTLTSKGTATVQRYYPTGAPTFNEWHLISAPISNAQAGIYDGFYLQWYEENPPGATPPMWHDIIPVNDPMTSLQGFAFYAPLDMMTFDYMGTLGDGSYGLPISAAGTVLEHWNLFGNPYPSCLDWDLVWPPNVGNLQSGAVYYLDQATGNYVSYNGGMGGGVRYVPPGQGFFVSGAIDMAPFVVDNTMRTHTGSETYYKDDFDNLLVLEASGNDFSDATYLRFDAGASEEMDQLDAFKLFTVSNPYLPQLYTVSGDNLSINVLPETEMVPAGFKVGVPGEYTINIKEVTGMANVILEDLQLQTQTDLMENDYTFIYNLDDPEGRFIIHFTPLAVDENLADLVNIYSYNKDVYVKVPENTRGDIVVFNTMGQEVVRTTITDALNIISLDKGAYYVVKVMSNESVLTKKVFVK